MRERTFWHTSKRMEGSPTGRFQPRLEAGAQRTLEGVGCKPLFGHLVLGYYDSALWQTPCWSHRTYRGNSGLP